MIKFASANYHTGTNIDIVYRYQLTPTPPSPADVWRDAVRRGHRGATQRSSTTAR